MTPAVVERMTVAVCAAIEWSSTCTMGGGTFWFLFFFFLSRRNKREGLKKKDVKQFPLQQHVQVLAPRLKYLRPFVAWRVGGLSGGRREGGEGWVGDGMRGRHCQTGVCEAGVCSLHKKREKPEEALTSLDCQTGKGVLLPLPFPLLGFFFFFFFLSQEKAIRLSSISRSFVPSPRRLKGPPSCQTFAELLSDEREWSKLNLWSRNWVPSVKCRSATRPTGTPSSPLPPPPPLTVSSLPSLPFSLMMMMMVDGRKPASQPCRLSAIVRNWGDAWESRGMRRSINHHRFRFSQQK